MCVALSLSQIPANNEIRELQESVIYLQCRSMKNNLIFTNLAEQPTEDVEKKLRTFIFEKPGIEHKIFGLRVLPHQCHRQSIASR
jgi:hypothetical protein